MTRKKVQPGVFKYLNISKQTVLYGSLANMCKCYIKCIQYVSLKYGILGHITTSTRWLSRLKREAQGSHL